MGGAQALLVDSPRDHLSPSRFVLEQLAIRDVFGCMTTELAPSILRDAFTPWFFEAETWSRSENEWESIERMFGMSRGMVDLIARVRSFDERGTDYRLVRSSRASAKPAMSSTNISLQLLICRLCFSASLRGSLPGFRLPLPVRAKRTNHLWCRTNVPS